MANIVNTTTVNNYNYQVSSGISGSNSSNTSSITLNVTAALVTFIKSNTPQYIDLGGTSTITYSITNNNAQNLTSATIVDPIFTLPGVTVSNIQGGALSGNTLTFNLPTGGLAQNNTATASLKVTISNTASPSSTLYNTTATGTFIIATTPVTTIVQTAKGNLEVNSAVLVVNKTVSPNVTSITAGTPLTYTITITNTGNVPATIPIGQFVDSWTANGLTNVQTTTPGFTISNNQITNSSPITINSGQTITIVLTGNAAIPS